MKFSKKLKLLTIIILSSSVFLIYKLTNHHNINYTALGDGFAQGIDCYGRVDYGYNDYVKDFLQENNKLMNYSNYHIKEDMTIESLYNTILTDKKMNNNNIKTNIIHILRDSDYLTISVGINDLLYKLSMTSEYTEENLNVVINEIEKSFNNLINEIEKIYNREIIIIGYYEPPNTNEFLSMAIKKLNNIYKKNKKVTYISTYTISENKNIFLSNPNSYYPNYKGYQLISNKIIDKISKKLEK